MHTFEFRMDMPIHLTATIIHSPCCLDQTSTSRDLFSPSKSMPSIAIEACSCSCDQGRASSWQRLGIPLGAHNLRHTDTAGAVCRHIILTLG